MGDNYKHLLCHKFILSCMFINGYFVVLGFMMFTEISVGEDQKTMLMALILLLTREMPTIFHHYFKSEDST